MVSKFRQWTHGDIAIAAIKSLFGQITIISNFSAGKMPFIYMDPIKFAILQVADRLPFLLCLPPAAVRRPCR